MFSLPPVLAHLVELTALLALMSVATGCGLLVLRVMRLGLFLSLGERLLFGMGVGYGVLGFVMLGMGLVGVVYGPIGFVLLLILGLAALRPLLSEARLLGVALREVVGGLRYSPNLFLAGVIVLCVGAALAKALVPVATQDDLMYHLALPRRYIEQHAVAFYPDSTYSLFPQLMEMLYTWGLLLGSDRLSVLFAFSAGLIGPAGAALFVRRYVAEGRDGVWRAAPLLAAAVFISTPLMSYVLRAANTDLAQASFDLLAVYAFYLGVSGTPGDYVYKGRDRTVAKAAGYSTAKPPFGGYGKVLVLGRHINPAMLALSGLCCGLSFSVKYYGFAVAVALLVALAVIMFAWRRGGGVGVRACVVPVFSFVVPAVCLAVVWLVRNYFAAGNPVWPLAGGVFGGSYWSAQASPETLLGRAPGLYLGSVWGGVQDIWGGITRSPLLIDGQQHAVSLGPLLIPALLALALVRWRRALGWVGYAAGAYWVLWAFFFSHTSLRYLSTFFLLSCVLGAYALVWLASRYRLLRWVLGGVVALVLGVLSVESALGAGQYLPTVLALDRGAEKQYLQAYMEDYSVMEYIRDKTPQMARIYVWDGQPRGYYIARPYVYARLVPLYTGFGGEAEGWRRRLGELGISYVLVHKRDILAPGQGVGADSGRAAGEAFAGRYFGEPVFTSGDYSLYELRR